MMAHPAEADNGSTPRPGLSRTARFVLRVGPPGWISHSVALLIAVGLMWWSSEPGFGFGAFLLSFLALFLLAPWWFLRVVLQRWARGIRRTRGDEARSIQPRRGRIHWLEVPLLLGVMLVAFFELPVYVRFLASLPALERWVAEGEPFSGRRSIGWYSFGNMADELGCQWFALRWVETTHAGDEMLTRSFHFVHSPDGRPPDLPDLEEGDARFSCRFLPLGGDWYFYTLTCDYDYWRTFSEQEAAE